MGHPILDKNVPKPQTLQLMLDFSNYIGENFTFIRIDFYEFNSQLYLDGVEFFPGSGHERFSSIKYDYLIGQYFKEKK